MNKFEIMKELEIVERKLYSSLGSRDYFVEDGYVKKFDDCYDIFIDTIRIREATKEEEYLYEKRWQLKDILRKC